MRWWCDTLGTLLLPLCATVGVGRRSVGRSTLPLTVGTRRAATWTPLGPPVNFVVPLRASLTDASAFLIYHGYCGLLHLQYCVGLLALLTTVNLAFPDRSVVSWFLHSFAWPRHAPDDRRADFFPLLFQVPAISPRSTVSLPMHPTR